MKKRLVIILMLLICLGSVQGGSAQEFAIKSDDTIRRALEKQVGELVTLRLFDGGELTGRVRIVTKELVQLGELSGRDYYDGVIKIEKITAIIVRVKDGT